MQNAGALILTGHLKEYPLSDILGILRHQRETGRLLIDYPAAPGVFFFKDGELVDAQIGGLKGIQAVWLATSLPDSAFNFNPLIKPPAQCIDTSLQKDVLRFIGCLEDRPVQNAEAGSGAPVTEIRGVRETATDVPHLIRKVLSRVSALASSVPAISNPDRTSYRNRILISAVAALLLGVIAAPIVVLTQDIFGSKPAPAPAAVEQPEPNGPENKAPAPGASESMIGPSGWIDVTHGDDEAVSVVQTREKIRQPTRLPASKKSGAEVATSAGLLPPPPDAKDEKSAEPPKVNKAATSGDPAIIVVTQVENGRVVEAYVANRRPGMEAFEASALRAARQRHFPPGTKGSEKVLIKVGKQ